MDRAGAPGGAGVVRARSGPRLPRGLPGRPAPTIRTRGGQRPASSPCNRVLQQPALHELPPERRRARFRTTTRGLHGMAISRAAPRPTASPCANLPPRFRNGGAAPGQAAGRAQLAPAARPTPPMIFQGPARRTSCACSCSTPRQTRGRDVAAADRATSPTNELVGWGWAPGPGSHAGPRPRARRRDRCHAGRGADRRARPCPGSRCYAPDEANKRDILGAGAGNCRYRARKTEVSLKHFVRDSSDERIAAALVVARHVAAAGRPAAVAIRSSLVISPEHDQSVFAVSGSVVFEVFASPGVCGRGNAQWEGGNGHGRAGNGRRRRAGGATRRTKPARGSRVVAKWPWPARNAKGSSGWTRRRRQRLSRRWRFELVWAFDGLRHRLTVHAVDRPGPGRTRRRSRPNAVIRPDGEHRRRPARDPAGGGEPGRAGGSTSRFARSEILAASLADDQARHATAAVVTSTAHVKNFAPEITVAQSSTYRRATRRRPDTNVSHVDPRTHEPVDGARGRRARPATGVRRPADQRRTGSSRRRWRRARACDSPGLPGNLIVIRVHANVAGTGGGTP